MKFGTLKTGEAEGALLAHSITLDGARLATGQRLGPDHIDQLQRAGIKEVVVARPEASDMDENAAAHALARIITGNNLEARAGARGRANIHATSAGLLAIGGSALTALNGLSEDISIATLTPFARVTPGTLAASVKIIPFALPEKLVAEAREMTAGKSLLHVHAFRPLRASLILTRGENNGGKPAEKSEAVTRNRLEAIGSSLTETRITGHQVAAVADELARMAQGENDLLLLLGSAATFHRGDVIPAAILEAGGEVTRVGMPVDPGNLLVLGRLGPKTVIGLPGCAASPALNGFDWVLERVAAGLPPDDKAFAAMGVGGLLKESPARPSPREKRQKNTARTKRPPEIHALVLAAGRSTRMGRENKLLQRVGGRTMIAGVVFRLSKSSFAGIHVVTGHDAEKIADALQGEEVRLVHNPDYASGMASSLQAGIGSLPSGADGVLILLGDMPDIKPATISRLLSEARRAGADIIAPAWHGRLGHPVYFGRCFFDALTSLEGDRGARLLLDQNKALLHIVEVEDAGILLDLDSAEALAGYQQKMAGKDSEKS